MNIDVRVTLPLDSVRLRMEQRFAGIKIPKLFLERGDAVQADIAWVKLGVDAKGAGLVVHYACIAEFPSLFQPLELSSDKLTVLGTFTPPQPQPQPQPKQQGLTIVPVATLHMGLKPTDTEMIFVLIEDSDAASLVPKDAGGFVAALLQVAHVADQIENAGMSLAGQAGQGVNTVCQRAKTIRHELRDNSGVAAKKLCQAAAPMGMVRLQELPKALFPVFQYQTELDTKVAWSANADEAVGQLQTTLVKKGGAVSPKTDPEKYMALVEKSIAASLSTLPHIAANTKPPNLEKAFGWQPLVTVEYSCAIMSVIGSQALRALKGDKVIQSVANGTIMSDTVTFSAPTASDFGLTWQRVGQLKNGTLVFDGTLNATVTRCVVSTASIPNGFSLPDGNGAEIFLDLEFFGTLDVGLELTWAKDEPITLGTSIAQAIKKANEPGESAAQVFNETDFGKT